MARLEHVNVTVADPDATAEMLIDLFGWRIRWQGDAIHGGRTIHVGGDDDYVAVAPHMDRPGGDDDYVAVYSGPGGNPKEGADSTYVTKGGLNHIGVVVDDLDAVEAKVTARGYTPHSHADYEPGRRFYFHEENGVEIEVIAYD